MDIDSQRTMAPLSGLDHPRRRQTLSLAELNVLARKISCVDAVTFAMAHEQIESFMGGVNLAAPRSSLKRTGDGASADERKWFAYPYIAAR
jgi:hypothetical protein